MGMLELTKTIWDLTKWRPPAGLHYTITLRPSAGRAEVFVTLSNEAEDLVLISVDRPPGPESFRALDRIAGRLSAGEGLAPPEEKDSLVIDIRGMGVG